MTPTIPITDPRFVYTPSHQTNIRKLFAKVRREQLDAKSKQEPKWQPQ